MYSCFKTKYFLRCDFLEAKDCQNSSYVWRSMLAAQPILKKGCYWRVGNGASIWVLKDCWLPNQPIKKILFQPKEEIWEWKVSNLIAWPNHQWDKERINAMFHPFDADAILQVPLSRRVVQDVVVWFGSKKGNYAVKSGYYVAKQLRMEESNLGESSRQGMNGAFWSRIWQANVPNKIKKISWRACLNILPTQANLARRRVVEEAWCNSCQLQDESVFHVLWGGTRCLDWEFISTSKIKYYADRFSAAGYKFNAETFKKGMGFILGHLLADMEST